MSFKPYHDKIEVKPLVKESPLASARDNFEEAGEVIAVGENVTKVHVGDVIFFRPYGCWETIEYEGEKHYVVAESNEYILGTYVAGQ